MEEEVILEPEKRKRGRPKKVCDVQQYTTKTVPPKKVGRPRKSQCLPSIPVESDVETNYASETVVSLKSPSRTRSRNSVWNRIVGHADRQCMPSQRLPTNRVVLQRFHTLSNSRPRGSTKTNDLAVELYFEILPIWQKANIPTLDQKTCVTRLVRLLSSWRNENCAKMVEGSKRESDYIARLDSLFKMSYIKEDEVKEKLKTKRLLQHDDAQEHPGKKTYEIDFEFYQGQLKNPQEGTIGSRDKDLERRRSVIMERSAKSIVYKQKQVGQVVKSRRSATENEVNESIGEEDFNVCSDSDKDDRDYIPYPEKRKPKRMSEMMLELPTKDLTKDISVLVARLKLSNRAATSVMARIILSAGGDLRDFVISKSTTYRHRILEEKDVEKKLSLKYQSLSADNPYGILHFDGKKVAYESGDIQERLIICLQQVASETQGRFLGAPHLPNGTGAAQCEALVRYVDENGIENQLIGHCWDTTSSNTGCNIGAAVLLDKACDQAHLWIACRRHAGERHCVHANNIVRGPTKSPEEQLFKHFKENFEFLDKGEVQLFKWDGDESSPTGPYFLSTERALAVRTWAEACCVDGTFPREDYRELLELLTHVLGGTIRRKLLRCVKIVPFCMQYPGAYDHVRFMAKAIYYIKMYMLLPQLIERELVTEVNVMVLERMSKFIILQYGQYFLKTALTTSAPRIDLEFWSNAKRYEVIDQEISEAVVKSVHRQMFYLTEELVLLSLCDKMTSNSEKEELVRALLRADRPQTFPPKKPEFKVDLLKNKSHDDPRLSHFVGRRSWLIFDLFDVDVHWMEYPAENWENIDGYKRFHKLTNGIICVNDIAERNVRNVLEYAEYSKDPDRRDRVVKVVNSHRELLNFHTFTKAELSNMHNI